MSRNHFASLSVLLLAAACGEERLIPRPPEKPIQDRFDQRKASSIDILFVIDNSRTMQEEREAVAANIATFVDYIDPEPARTGESGEVDYRIAVATTDANRSGGALIRGTEPGAPLIIEPGAGYDPVAAFQDTIAAIKEGGALEQGFEAALLALENAGEVRDGAGEPMFMRENAYLYVIVVSDEEDSSFGETRYYHRAFESLKGTGNENTVAVSAIAGPVPSGCATAEAGERYAEIAGLTGGVLGDICTSDWGATLQELAVTGIGLRKRFQLDHPPRDYDGGPEIDWEDLTVRVHYPCSHEDSDPLLAPEICQPPLERSCNGKGEGQVTCFPFFRNANGWSFDTRENSIVFEGDAVPGPGSTIEVEYFPRDK
jgi:hypothetical protein